MLPYKEDVGGTVVAEGISGTEDGDGISVFTFTHEIRPHINKRVNINNRVLFILRILSVIKTILLLNYTMPKD